MIDESLAVQLRLTASSYSAMRVFLSYARRDGAVAAARLHADLTARGFEVWQDIREITGGASWTREIEDGIDQADAVLALLTTGSYRPEICRAEQLRSLRKGKCVIPVLSQPGAHIPLHLEAKNYHDLSSIELLIEDIRGRKGVELKEEFRETYVTAPPLPINYLERSDALDNLRNAVITDDSNRHIALTALKGMGGIGKTVLAQALCHDEVVQQAFPDGVIWSTAGKEPTHDLVTRMREVGKALRDDLSRYDNDLACRNQHRTTIRNKAALIVVDDVWRPGDVEPFLAESPCSRVLFTTRDGGIAAELDAEQQRVDVLSEEQSRELLAARSRTTPLPPVAADLIRECGRLPLAVAVIGTRLRERPSAY